MAETHEHHEHHVSSLVEYFAVFAILMVGTALTVWVAYLDLGAFNTPVALAIAITKATFVVIYFMHVKYSTKLTWLFAGAGFLWLIILLGILMMDYISRHWVQTPMSQFLQ